MPANTEPLHEAADPHNYYYRRVLGPADLVPAIVMGVGAGLMAFYVARLMAERTPLIPPASPGTALRRRPRVAGDPG